MVFSLKQLRRMLEMSCQLRFATLGNIVVQSTGLLIGGLLSLVAAVCLLSHEESLFLRGESASCVFIPEGWLPEESVLGLRYVDDLLLLSKCLCHSCLKRLVDSIYSVSFEINTEGLEQTWVDIVSKVNVETGAIYSGFRRMQTDHGFRICMGRLRKNMRLIWAAFKPDLEY